jgi:Alcohol dehydrogenase GroES-like domain
MYCHVEQTGMNFIDTYQRAGLYPNSSWPMILGNEAAGEVVQLPTDPKVLEDKWYKLGGYKIGTKVRHFVCSPDLKTHFLTLSWLGRSRTPLLVSWNDTRLISHLVDSASVVPMQNMLLHLMHWFPRYLPQSLRVQLLRHLAKASLL